MQIDMDLKKASNNKILSALIGVASLVVIIYFGTLLYQALKPETWEQKYTHCLELGSDKRAAACIKLLPERRREECSFEITELTYSPDSGTYYKNYVGVIRNTSNEVAHLKAMVGKIYQSDGTLIADGYTDIDEDIEAGKGLPFKINVQSDSSLKQEGLVEDIYPWFTSCE